jgi:Tfp pilus assembly PilM family ATPase
VAGGRARHFATGFERSWRSNRLLAVILKKAGIKLVKTPDEMDEEELFEAIDEAKSRLAVLS